MKYLVVVNYWRDSGMDERVAVIALHADNKTEALLSAQDTLRIEEDRQILESHVVAMDHADGLIWKTTD